MASQTPYRLTFTENGGDASGLVEVAPYSELQSWLSARIAEHIGYNPEDQPIAEVSIKWKSPSEREYRYVLSAEKPAANVAARP